MSKKKSLGSSPIEYKSQKSSMDFIPDLGVSATAQKPENSGLKSAENQKSKEKTNNKKKVVSYSLEAELVNKVKTIANKKEIYYSSLVSQALESWIAQHS